MNTSATLVCHYRLPDGFIPTQPMQTQDLEGEDFVLTDKGRIILDGTDIQHHGALRFSARDEQGRLHEYRALFDRGGLMALVGGVQDLP
jgi:hypothetical protein